jgi:hypothetical protein
MSNKKAIVVGRHAGEVPGFKIVEQRAITWPATSAECLPVLEALVLEGLLQDAVILLQNTPGQVAAACCGLAQYYGQCRPTVGVIVSVPGPRPGKVSRTFILDDPLTRNEASIHMLAEMQASVRFANPRAEAISETPGTVTVTVDGPPMPFEFSHIEWLF